jgi:putative MATE family efflux protein
MTEESSNHHLNGQPTGGYRSSRDWTQGSVIKSLLSLSWPMIITNSVNVLGPLADMIWVGRLGPDSVAAVGVASMMVMLVHASLLGIFTGLRAMVSRYMGAQDRSQAVHVAQQALVMAAICGILLAVVGILLDRWMLGLLGVSPEVIEIGAPYMRINFIGMIAMGVRFATDGTMQASGDTLTPMKLAVIFRLVHIILCPFLVFGWIFFPAMGASGAAITGVFSQTVGSLLGLAILISGRSRLRLSFTKFRFDLGVIWRLITIGIPASLMMVQMQLGHLVMTIFVVGFGTAAVAAHTICQRIDMLLMMPLLGIGASAGVLVGLNLGAHHAERAEKSGWIALLISEGFLIIAGTVIFIWAETVVNIFSSDSELGAIADNYIKIAAIGYMIMAFTLVLQNCISGAGDTLPPLVIGLIMVWVIQIPLGWLLSRTELGVYGVRWAVVVGLVLSLIAYTLYFRSGRWKRKRI